MTARRSKTPWFRFPLVSVEVFASPEEAEAFEKNLNRAYAPRTFYRAPNVGGITVQTWYVVVRKRE